MTRVVVGTCINASAILRHLNAMDIAAALAASNTFTLRVEDPIPMWTGERMPARDKQIAQWKRETKGRMK
jgi:hypothetical protein